LSEVEVKKLWEQHWKDTKSVEDVASPIGKLLRRQRLKIMFKMLAPLDRNISIVDMGCGGGRTLQNIRSAGFKNAIGIDYSTEALGRCEKIGYIINKDVFLVDAKETHYPDRYFDLTFSEGLWEHFTNPVPFMDEQMRISKTYLMIIQPDHFSFFGFLLKKAWDMFASKRGGVNEYSFRLSYFEKHLKKGGFKLISKHATCLNEQAVMLFRREN
jgi:SAM-dependent methyltransferase